MTTDPIRLLSQSDLTTSERLALENAHLGVDAGYDFARGEARLLAGLEALSRQLEPGPSSLGARHGVLGKLSLKTWLGLTLGLALMGTTYVFTRSSPRSQLPAPRSAPVARTPTRSLEPQPVVTSLAPRDPTPETAPPARAPARRRNLPEAPKAVPTLDSTPIASVKPAEPATDPRAELRAIAQAKALSVHDPQAALRMLEQIRVQFPQGYFGEERAALTILALARSGQSELARQQASSFLERYPNGPHSDRVRRALAAP